MIKLALPVVLTYVGQLTMQLADMIVVGRLNPAALGGVALGTAFFYLFMVAGLGLLTGQDFLVAHAHGAGKRDECRRIFIQSLIVAFVASIPLTLIPWWLAGHLEWFGTSPDVAIQAEGYLKILSLSMLPTLLFFSGRQYVQALGKATPPMVILLAANVANAILNYGFVLGHWGFPRWEAAGSAVATLLSRMMMLLAMLVYIFWWDRPLRRNLIWPYYKPEKKLLTRIAQLGFPASLQMVLEVGAFSAATTFASRLSAVQLAAHQIVINMASLTFMVPMGISSATAVLIGQYLGKEKPEEAGRFGWRGLGLGVGFMTFSAVMLLLFPEQIIHIYSQDAGVVAEGKRIMFLAALFQISDAIQVISTGALRGVADTKSSMIGNLIGHWVIGLPIGVSCCFEIWGQGHWKGLPGLWLGLSLGLTSVAALLLFRWIQEYRSLSLGRIPRRVSQNNLAIH